MNIIIIEDEKNAAEELRRMLLAAANNYVILAILESVDSACKWLENHQMPDLIFSDIHLSDGLSFNIFKKITITCPIIFCTAFDQYALDAFKVNGIDYLLKPIDKETLAKSLLKIKNLANYPKKETLIANLAAQFDAVKTNYKTTYLVNDKASLIPMPLSSVAYFCVEETKTYLYTTANKRYLINKTLDEIENEVNPLQFYRANRKFLIAFSFIKKVHYGLNRKLEVELNIDLKDFVSISKEKATGFINWMENR